MFYALWPKNAVQPSYKQKTERLLGLKKTFLLSGGWVDRINKLYDKKNVQIKFYFKEQNKNSIEAKGKFI